MFGVFFLGFRQSFQIVWSSWFEKKGAVVPIVELPNTNKISIYIIYLHIFLYTDIYQSIFIYVFIHIYIYIYLPKAWVLVVRYLRHLLMFPWELKPLL